MLIRSTHRGANFAAQWTTNTLSDEFAAQCTHEKDADISIRPSVNSWKRCWNFNSPLSELTKKVLKFQFAPQWTQGKWEWAFSPKCQLRRFWNKLSLKEVCLRFFVSNIHESRSNSLSFTKIWINSLFYPKTQIFHCSLMTLILWFALISKWFELQMWD